MDKLLFQIPRRITGKYQCYFVRETAYVRLPAYSEIEILADVSDFVHENQIYNNIILEGVELQIMNVMVAHAVVTLGVSVPIRVMNPTDQPVTLYKGTRIAHLTEVEEVDDGSMLTSSVQYNRDISSCCVIQGNCC